MNITTILYTIIIKPLELLFTVIYTLLYYVLNNYGLSIIFLSLIMNILLLPLYNRADQIQDEENAIEKKLKKGVDHIKKAFKGDERFMMLQTYYRQNNYKPIYAIKGLLPLLLEIPFFMAAYNFLSTDNLLNEISFGPITDLSLPDGMICLFGINLNILPVIMTVVNIISSNIYTKQAPIKSKIQLYVMAIVFLVVLYNSPSGLALYWTCNNVFSLVKNILRKIENCGKIICLSLSFVGCASIFYVVFVQQMSTTVMQCGVIAILLLLQLPLLLLMLGKKIKKYKINVCKNDSILIISCVLLTILVGLYIPINVINLSPAEFVDRTLQTNPLMYVFSSSLLAIGTFLIWCTTYYYLMNEKIKPLLALLFSCISLVCFVNYEFFNSYLGTMSSLLVYDDLPAPTILIKIVNLALDTFICVFVYILIYKKSNIIRILSITVSIIMISISIKNSININNIVNETRQIIAKSSENISIPLSKEGKNVVVIMLDKSIGSYFPYLLEEKKELQESFSGFTYYPNTISYGGYTKSAAPALFGGYEYIPVNTEKMLEERDAVQIHNEALMVMPVLFDINGFEVTVADQPYANYSEVTDLSIYDEYDDINAFITKGVFTEAVEGVSNNRFDILNRKLFYYSFTRIVPCILHNIVYNYGFYNDTIILAQEEFDYDFLFADNYYVLDNLENITIFEENGDTFTSFTNEITHSPTLLQEPNYELVMLTDNKEYDIEHYYRYSIMGGVIDLEGNKQHDYYEVNMSAMIELAKWFDYLRENNVYDNTRIIVVSDHSGSLKQFNDLVIDDNDVMQYNPLLLVKDFYSDEFNIDYSFMTNADVPSIATNELIVDPRNPFTGKSLSIDSKNGKQYIYINDDADKYYAVEENIFVKDNWEIINKDQVQ